MLQAFVEVDIFGFGYSCFGRFAFETFSVLDVFEHLFKTFSVLDVSSFGRFPG